MNVMFINTIDNRGGAPRVVYSLKEGLRERGHAATLFVKHKYSTDADVHIARWPSLPNRLIKKITDKDAGSVLSSALHRLLATDIEWFGTDNILRTDAFKKADIVHCHNLHGNYFKLDTLRKMAEKKPVIWTFHDMWPITSHCGHAYDGTLVDGFYACPNLKTYQDLLWDNEKHLTEVKRKIYAATPFHIVVPCGWLKRKVEASVLKNHPLALIYNGIDHKIFKPSQKQTVREKLGIPHDKKIILFASGTGGASEEKGGAYLAAAAKHFSVDENIRLICVGQDERHATFLSENLRYVPFISDQKILAEYYSAADVFLFTSLAETFPLVILEALSCGLPVVSFDVGGVKEAVRHKQEGYIAEYKNAEDVIHGLEFVLSQSDERKNVMSVNARNRVLDNFTLELMLKNYIELYEKTLG